MSKIEWTGETWNPVSGCSIVSPGCTNCYAMGTAARIERMMPSLAHYAGLTKPSKAGPVWTGKVALAPEHILTKPLGRKVPTTWFVNSMSDLFHEDVPDEWILRVLDVIRQSSRDGGSNIGRIGNGEGEHTFQCLTKRSGRMRSIMSRLRWDGDHLHLLDEDDGRARVLLNNLWLGVSVERQQEANARIPDLLNTPAAVRFVSAEPLLGPVDFTRLELVPDSPATSAKGKRYVRAGVHLDALRGRYCESGVEYVGDWDVNLPRPPAGATQRKLNWLILGGESGSRARPMHPEWARSIRDQCTAAGVAFFFKQFGEWCPYDPWDGPTANLRWMSQDGGWIGAQADDPPLKGYSLIAKRGKKAAGRELDGREWNEMPAGAGGAP